MGSSRGGTAPGRRVWAWAAWGVSGRAGLGKALEVRLRERESRFEVCLLLAGCDRCFYNSRHIRERLGWLSPIEFEEQHYADQATAERTNLNPRQSLFRLLPFSRPSEPSLLVSRWCWRSSQLRCPVVGDSSGEIQ